MYMHFQKVKIRLDKAKTVFNVCMSADHNGRVYGI